MPPRADKRETWTLLLLPPATVALMALLWPTDVHRQFENITLDWRFRARADSDPPPDPRLALIGVGERSLKALGRWEDWTRDIHGRLAHALTRRPPEVLAFDFFFPEPSGDPTHDESFAGGLALHPGAITGVRIDTTSTGDPRGDSPGDAPYLGKTQPLPRVSGDRFRILGGARANVPIPPIAEGAWSGIINCPSSRVDGKRRKVPLVGRIGEEVYPSLALQVLMQLGDTDPEEVSVVLGEAIHVPRSEGGAWTIPVDERGFMRLNYRDTGRLAICDYATVLAHLLNLDAGGEWPEALPPLEDQVVLVGQSAEGLADLGPTPYRAHEPLVRIQATALDTILRDDHLRTVSVPAFLGGWLAVAWLTLLLLRRAPVAVQIGAPLLLVAAHVGTAFLLFEHQSLALPLVLPVGGFLLLHGATIGDRLVTERRAKRHLQSVFGTYVARAVVDRIVESGRTPELGGEKVEITAMFTDIQSFSTFSEQLPPEILVDLMVEYLTAMTDIVLDRDGTLDKYIGDAIAAMFGAPLRLPDHAREAVVCAIHMQRRQAELGEEWRRRGDLPELVHHMRTRIGLNSGTAVVGNMGSRRRFNYTMMGDNVNLGARCESGAKTYGVYTMVAADTRDAARATRDDVTYRFLDRLVVKGRTRPVDVHEVVEFERAVTPEVREGLELHAAGMERYLECDWNGALENFQRAAERERFRPDRDPGVATNPSLLMIERCREMKLRPPPDDWDGVFRMTSK